MYWSAFGAALAENLLLLLGGGVVTLAMMGWEIAHRRRPAAADVWPMLATLLLAAAFAWNEEHKRVEELTAQVTTEAPKLVVEPTHLLKFADGPNVVDLYANISITNAGAKSVATGYTAQLINASGEVLELRPGPIPKLEQIDPSVRSVFESMRIQPERDLSERTFIPIDRGEMRRGWLRYRAEVPLTALDHPGVTLRIRVWDFNKREYAAEIGDNNADCLALPEDVAKEAATRLELHCPGL